MQVVASGAVHVRAAPPFRGEAGAKAVIEITSLSLELVPRRIGSSNVAMLWGLRASIEFANRLGMARIEKRHRAMADYLHAEMVKRGAES